MTPQPSGSSIPANHSKTVYMKQQQYQQQMQLMRQIMAAEQEQVPVPFFSLFIALIKSQP